MLGSVDAALSLEGDGNELSCVFPQGPLLESLPSFNRQNRQEGLRYGPFAGPSG